MTKEIVEAVKALEQEKGISSDKLMDALADALLSAYKKTPGAAKYARVDLALCERVTKHLQHLLADYSLEVSSPGPKYRDRRNATTSSEPKESLQ